MINTLETKNLDVAWEYRELENRNNGMEGGSSTPHDSRLRTLSQLLNERVTEPPFIVEPIIAIGQITIVGAPEKHFKSTVILNMSYAASDGAPLLDQSWLDPMRSRTVLIFDQELGTYEMRKRAQAIQSYRGSYRALENIYVVSQDWDIVLDTPAGQRRFEYWIDQANTEIVVIDPIRNFYSGCENDSAVVNRIMTYLGRLAKERRLAIVFAHHANKDSRDGRNPAALRGSTAFAAGAASICMIVKPTFGNDERIELNWTLRFARKPRPLTLDFSGEDTWTFTETKKN